MEFLESIILDPSSITFTLLFVGFFIYITKRNEQREEKYIEREDQLYQALKECHTANKSNIPPHLKGKRK